MKETNKFKIGLSLLIALAFMLPTGAVLAGETSPDAGVNKILERRAPINENDMMVQLPRDGPIAQEDPFCGVYIQGLEGLPHGALIAPGQRDLLLKLWYDPACYHQFGPPIIKAFCEIYKKCCGAEVTMYETSFEDNFDIYNNWIQEDADCGVTKEGNIGFYDTWTWTDARASCGSEHSFKNTMYDIYKGNQDDYLECTKSFDISDQQAVRFEFDCWVEGDYDAFWAMGFVDPDGVVRNKRMYTAFDYLDFEIGDWGGNWVNPCNFFSGIAHQDPFDWMIFAGAAHNYLLPGAYKFPDTVGMNVYEPSPFQDYTPKAEAIGGGWWHVWYEVPTWVLAWYGLDITDIQFRFSWHSDPEIQYEGAYVDCIKVISIEDCEDKIFQTHTQGPVVLDPMNPDVFYDPACGNFWVKFPMGFDFPFTEECGQKETCYDLLLWIQVLNDPCTYWTPYDWPFPVDVMVCSGEWFSCEVANLVIETSFGQQQIIPGAGIMLAGDDAHIMADVHVCGAVPTENLVIEAYAEKVIWTEEYFWDVESPDINWEFGHFGDAPTCWHRTQVDAWSGNYALGCFREGVGHYENDMYVDYALNNKLFDVCDVKAAICDYYTKFITEGGGDYWAFMLYDPATNYVLGNIGGVGFPTSGYQPEWIGPMQPYGKYQSFDLLAAYDYWHDIRGMFHNPDGSDACELGIGFAMWGTDGSGYVNAQAEADGVYWSGLYFDDISVKIETVGEKIWEDTLIIPGPMDPCDWTTVQFEWEDVPYCNYKVTVKCEQGCQNCGISEQYAQILVVGNKEKAHYKEVESFDYTQLSEGEWGISSSDYDNYLASNPTTTLYDSYMNAVAELCPDHGGDCDCCIDISHLAPIGPGTLLMDFTAWWDIEGSYPNFAVFWDYCVLEIATSCPADTFLDWHQVAFFGDLQWDHRFPESSAYYYGGIDEPEDNWVTMSQLEFDYGELSWMGIPVWNDMIDLGAIIAGIDPGATEMGLRFRFVSDSGFEFRGMKIDDIIITNLIYNDDVFPPGTEDFVDPCDTMDNWCASAYGYGQFWEFIDPEWCTTFPPVPVEDGLVWHTEIIDCFEAYLSIETMYNFDPGARGLVQIRIVGEDWFTLDEFTGTNPSFPLYDTYHYNLNFWVGNAIEIRFLAEGADGAGGTWCVKNLIITGKQDHDPPISTLTMSGTMKDSGWYSTPVQIKITATDNIGVAAIHYILDGVEKVVAGDTATFTVSGNGEHTLEYWSVDTMGNEEVHKTVPPFRIDSGSAPTVAITAPEPGLYLFGNKILSTSKIIIIGAFNIQATASDADSGIYKVKFFLDGDLIGESTTPPYKAYCAVKHMGAGTIKVTAEDFAQNTAEDTLDVTYYKFL